jgi:hypothetical protein
MAAFRYYWSVVLMAFTHSIQGAHAIVFLGIIVVGGAAYFVPELHLNMEGPGIAATVFGSIVALRLVMAPYWLHQEQEKRIPKTRAEWQRSDTRLDIAWKYIATKSKCGFGHDWASSYGIAREILYRTIINGEIDVWGKKKPEDVALEKIPISYWKDHKIDIDNISKTYRSDFSKSPDEIIYYDLHVDREDIIRCWPKATRRELWREERRRMKHHRATQKI